MHIKISLDNLSPELKVIMELVRSESPHSNEKTYAEYKSTPRTRGDERPTICFTGIETQRRFELKEIAEAHDFRVVKSVPKNLFALVLGENAGPAKLTKAHECGIRLMTEPEFLALCEHIESQGEIDPAAGIRLSQGVAEIEKAVSEDQGEREKRAAERYAKAKVRAIVTLRSGEVIEAQAYLEDVDRKDRYLVLDRSGKTHKVLKEDVLNIESRLG